MTEPQLGWFLLILTGTAAALAWTTAGTLVYAYFRGLNDPIVPAIIGWVAHVGFFYTVNVLFRLFFGYLNPTIFFTLWGVLLFIHAFSNILGIVLLELKKTGDTDFA